MFKNMFEKDLKLEKRLTMLNDSSDKPRAYICRSYFLRPQCCKSQILEDSTDNCIIVLTIAIYYQEKLGPRNKRGCF